MAVDISEIGVKIAVGDPAAPAESLGPTPTPAEPQPKTVMDNLVARCVRRVLAALRVARAR
ncbi:DUF5908 family protein [Sphingomonas sp. MMS24-J45]|uniref:DUF5908 family protein n=1 Tax=Sphingomonas sp. MMS24-J45 TaxID=3238806 RepID=UPI00384B5AE3